MVHLDELSAKYADKGLSVIGVTNENRGLVDKFVAETSAKHAIVIEEGDSAETYQISGFPSTFLIDANGKVAWAGNGAGFAPDLLERLLKDVRLVPALPPKLSAAQKLLDARKFGDARKALEKPAADEKADEGDRKAAQAAIAWIDESAKSMLDTAAADATKGDVVAAAARYEKVAEQFRGVEAGDTAAKALKDLLADPAKKKEVDAAKRLDDLRERISGMKPKKAIPAVKGFLSSYKGTKAADEAQKILDKLTAEEAK